MTPEFFDRLFVVFFAGAGVGLAAALNLALHRHGGRRRAAAAGAACGAALAGVLAFAPGAATAWAAGLMAAAVVPCLALGRLSARWPSRAGWALALAAGLAATSDAVAVYEAEHDAWTAECSAAAVEKRPISAHYAR